jgi:hypothetical protein
MQNPPMRIGRHTGQSFPRLAVVPLTTCKRSKPIDVQRAPEGSMANSRFSRWRASCARHASIRSPSSGDPSAPENQCSCACPLSRGAATVPLPARAAFVASAAVPRKVLAISRAENAAHPVNTSVPNNRQ